MLWGIRQTPREQLLWINRLKDQGCEVTYDEEWMKRLWKWADENNIPDYEYEDDLHHYNNFDDYYKYYGFPRKLSDLLSFSTFKFESKLVELPREIGNLINLENLYLNENYHIKEIPEEIGNLINLKELMISYKIRRLTKRNNKFN